LVFESGEAEEVTQELLAPVEVEEATEAAAAVESVAAPEASESEKEKSE